MDNFHQFDDERTKVVKQVAEKFIERFDAAKNPESIVREFAAGERIKPLSAQQYIRGLKNNIYRHIFHNEGDARGMSVVDQHERLARLFHILGIKENDAIISEIRKVKPSFEYPTEMEVPSDLLRERLHELE